MIAAIRSKFAEDDSEPSTVGLHEVIAEVLALVDGELQNCRVVVRNETPAGLPRLTAQRARLQLAFFNLVMNAIEAMKSVTDRERVLTITAKLGDADDLLMTVEDSGTGIDPDCEDRLFEAFFTTKAHRAGMGLPICRKIIEIGGRPGLGRSAAAAWLGFFCKTADRNRFARIASAADLRRGLSRQLTARRHPPRIIVAADWSRTTRKAAICRQLAICGSAWSRVELCC